MKFQLMIEPSRSRNRALQISRSLTGLLSLQIRAAIVVPLDGDRNYAADFDRGSIVREINISLDVYGVAGGSDANYLPLGCDAPKLEEKECCQREQHVLRCIMRTSMLLIYCHTKIKVVFWFGAGSLPKMTTTR